MELLEGIYTRRSIRSFIDKKIDDETIEKILKGAMLAPSARNCQGWEFIVVDRKDILEKMAEIIPYGKMLPSASHGILVCVNTTQALNFEYGVIDCSAATQNILLSALALEIGSVWLGVYPREERVAGLKEIFNLPEHIIPVNAVALGYSKNLGKEVDRYESSKVHLNGF